MCARLVQFLLSLLVPLLSENFSQAKNSSSSSFVSLAPHKFACYARLCFHQDDDDFTRPSFHLDSHTTERVEAAPSSSPRLQNCSAFAGLNNNISSKSEAAAAMATAQKEPTWLGPNLLPVSWLVGRFCEQVEQVEVKRTR